MKKIINFLKTLVCGIMPAIAGGLIVLNVHYIIKNIQAINTGAGWSVVLSFLLATIESILTICLLYEFGVLQINSDQWVKYNKAKAANTINSSTSDNETSDEATDTSSGNQSKSKRKKS